MGSPKWAPRQGRLLPDTNTCIRDPQNGFPRQGRLLPDTTTWTNIQRHFHGWHTLFVVFDTSIISDPLEYLTKNDATGGAHLFRPTTDFVYGLNMCLFICDTFIRSNPFESLTENDATGGPHLFRPTTDLFYGLKHRF